MVKMKTRFAKPAIRLVNFLNCSDTFCVVKAARRCFPTYSLTAALAFFLRDLAAFQINLRHFQLLRRFLDCFTGFLRYRPGASGFLFVFGNSLQFSQLLPQRGDLLCGLVHIVRSLFSRCFPASQGRRQTCRYQSLLRIPDRRQRQPSRAPPVISCRMNSSSSSVRCADLKSINSRFSS